VNLSDVLAKVKRRPTRKRCGRGRGSGLGKTSGRGHKGAAARSGWRRRYGYDGGQTSLVRRLPKRGFTNARFRRKYDVVNLGLLDSFFGEGDDVRLEVLVARGILNAEHGRLKVLGNGDLKKKLTIAAHSVSESALKKIEASGSKFEPIGPQRKKKKKFIRRPPEAPKSPESKDKDAASPEGAEPKAKGAGPKGKGGSPKDASPRAAAGGEDGGKASGKKGKSKDGKAGPPGGAQGGPEGK
jgi:large subunit ribosomal protein L15